MGEHYYLVVGAGPFDQIASEFVLPICIEGRDRIVEDQAITRVVGCCLGQEVCECEGPFLSFAEYFCDQRVGRKFISIELNLADSLTLAASRFHGNLRFRPNRSSSDWKAVLYFSVTRESKSSLYLRVI